MLYPFHGGPLDGRTIVVPDRRIIDGTYTHLQWGKYKSAFHLLPEIKAHRYTLTDGLMVYMGGA